MSGSNILTDMPLTSDRDRSALLRYDDHQRIGYLGSAERRAVTHPELHGNLALGGRQYAPRRRDPIVGDHHRPVVQRRILEKDIFAADLYEQILAQKNRTIPRNEYSREIVLL